VSWEHHPEPWIDLLAGAAPRNHIVQFYQDEPFLCRAVCRFVAAGLAGGESVILVPAAAHWELLRPRLEAEGVDVPAGQSQGQLTVLDADKFLLRFMREGMPDAQTLLGLAREIVVRARGASREGKVRVWGEMVNVLWQRGAVAASMHLDELFNRVAHDHNLAIFCSFLMDNFSGEVHARVLPTIGRTHTHLIPAERYACLERAVAEALRETVGPVDAGVLESLLLTRYPAPLDMPRPQALLLALRQLLPLVADAVLVRSRRLYAAATEGNA